jgi:phage baseplate assembly protein W
MSERAERAWRFVHPAVDVPSALAERTPGLHVDATGGIDVVEGDACVRQSILLLLSTARGERVMRPDYGCDLGRLAFAPNDATTAGLAIHYVRAAVERWEPRARVLRVDAGRDLFAGADLGRSGDPDARLDVVLDYQVRESGHADRLALSIDLTEGSLQ